MIENEHHKLEDKDISLTPKWMIDSLGVFDMDCCGLKAHATASRVIQLPEDGLTATWEGRVWCNPPYSKPEPWVKRMHTHGRGISLTLASTGTQWFQKYCFGARGILFLDKRPKFVRLDGSAFSIMRDCALTAYGEGDLEALKNSGLTGRLIELSSQEDWI